MPALGFDQRALPGFIVWFTGMPSAGKSTLSKAVGERLRTAQPVEILDGDEVREYLSKGLGFTRQERDTNVNRIGYVARLLARNGIIAITAAISPYKDARAEVRRLAEVDKINFVEVFVRADLKSLVQRDVKGLYKKALSGELLHFTGISDPYEAPDHAEVTVDTDTERVEQSVDKILGALKARGLTH